MIASFTLPLPDSLMRIFAVNPDNGLPVIAAYRLEEEEPAQATVAATFSLVSTDTVRPGTFAWMSRNSEEIFLKRPEGRLIRRDDESALYSFASPDRLWEGITLFCAVRGLLVTFTMTYPYGDRARARQTRAALLEWAGETQRRNPPVPLPHVPRPERPQRSLRSLSEGWCRSPRYRWSNDLGGEGGG